MKAPGVQVGGYRLLFACFDVVWTFRTIGRYFCTSQNHEKNSENGRIKQTQVQDSKSKKFRRFEWEYSNDIFPQLIACLYLLAYWHFWDYRGGDYFPNLVLQHYQTSGCAYSWPDIGWSELMGLFIRVLFDPTIQPSSYDSRDLWFNLLGHRDTLEKGGVFQTISLLVKYNIVNSIFLHVTRNQTLQL